MYIDTGYITDVFGARYTFGTHGTCLMTVTQAEKSIERASAYIDYNLSGIYGTHSPTFGTNSIGTLAVPQLIQDCCADISLGLIYQNTTLFIQTGQEEYGKFIYQRGIDLLDKLKNVEMVLSPYAGTILTPVPQVSAGAVQVRGETITLTGTAAVVLENRTILKDSIKVYGTSELNPSQFTEGRDYNVWCWNQDNTGTNFGYVSRVGTGTMGDNITVRVDYQYRTGNIFQLNDYLKWGHSSKENRG